MVEPPALAPADRVTRFDAPAKRALEAAQQALVDCRLTADNPGEWFDFEYFDLCEFGPQKVPSFRAAVNALDQLVREDPQLDQGSRATLTRALRDFASWLELSVRAAQTRGTLALYQDVARTWNDYQPKDKVELDPPHIVHQYTVQFPERFVDYVIGKAGYRSHLAFGLPLPWRRGVHGPRLP